MPQRSLPVTVSGTLATTAQNQGLFDDVALVILAESGILITVITGFEYHPMSRSIMASLAYPDRLRVRQEVFK